MRWPTRVVVWIAASLLSSCVVSLEVDPNTRVSCETDADCPNDFVCRTSIHLCVSTSAADVVAPALKGAAVLAPRIARAGVDISARFSVSERLERDPLVTLVGASDVLTMTLVADDSNPEAGYYTYRTVSAGTEAEGDYVLTIELIDGAGNESAGLGGDRVRLDFSAPKVGVSWALESGRTAARSGDTLSYVIVPDLGSRVASARVIDGLDNTVVVLGTDAIVRKATALEGTATLALPLTGVEAVAVEVLVADEAGNLSDPLTSRTPLLPVVNGAPPPPSLAINGTPVTGSLVVRVDVTATAAADIWFEGDLIDDDKTAQWIPLVPSYLLTLQPGDGNKVVRAKVRDGAFNESPFSEAAITYAAGAITASPTLQAPAGQSAIKNGDLLTVSGSATIGTLVESARLVEVPSGALVQTLPLGVVSLDAGGTLSGAFVVLGLMHAEQVALEVVVKDAEDHRSLATNSRSLPLTADLVPPASTTASVQQGSVVATTDLDLLLVGSDVSEVRIEGDVAGAGVWLTYTPVLPIDLLTGDGVKTIVVRFRDGAFNETLAPLAVTLDTGVPSVFLLIQGPWSVARVKNHDTLTLSGSANANVSLVSAALVSLDSALLPLVGPGCLQDITASVSLTGTTIAGAPSVGSPCAGTHAIAARVIVRNAAGTSSSSAALSVNAMVLDNDPPSPATASFKTISGASTGYAPSAAATVLVSAVEPQDGLVELYLSGDAQGPRVGAWVSLPTNGEETVTLTPGQGTKSLSVQFRDATGNVSSALPLQIEVDTDSPSAPLAAQIRIVESAPAPFDAAAVDGTTNTFTLEALTGAFPSAAFAEVHAGPALDATTLLGTIALDGAFSFAATAVPPTASSGYYLRGRDRAGHVSAATLVRVPRCTFTSLDPSPAKAGLQADGAPVDLQFSCDMALSAEPTVVLNGTAAVRVSGDHTVLGGDAYAYTVQPAGTEPQGVDKAVIRLNVAPPTTLAASGSVGTDAMTATLDFTAPSLDLAKLTLVENVPGSHDQLLVAPAAVSDLAGSETLDLLQYPVRVRVRNYTDTQTLLDVNAASDGSFVGVNLLDNIHPSVALRLTDAAGNTASAVRNNDIDSPVISSLVVTPIAARHGQQITITFDVTEAPGTDASDLSALPQVRVGVHDATFDNLGTTLTSDGATHAFRYVYTLDQTLDAPEGIRPVQVIVRDVPGNRSIRQANLHADFTAPSSTLSAPGASASWNGRPAIRGTASDTQSGVALVEYALQNVASTQYFNGIGFASATPVWLPTAGTINWASTQSIPYAAGQSYVLTRRASDRAGNVETPPAAKTFAFSSSLPQPPTGLTASSPRPGVIRLSWTPPAIVPLWYRVYYAREGDVIPPYLGTGATEGVSPIQVIASTTTSLDLTELPRGRYVIAVTSASSTSESNFSVAASAASRWWKWVLPSGIGSAELASIVRAPNDEWIASANPARTTIWRSADGVSWTPSAVSQYVGLAVEAAAGRLVATSAGSAAYSDDSGRTWTLTALPGSAGGANAIAQTPGRLIITGTGGKIWYSTNNGTSWTAAQSNATATLDTAWAAPGCFGAIAKNASEAVFSSDGINFTTVSYPLSTTRFASYAGGIVVAAHTSFPLIARSVDGGQSWATLATPTAINHAYGDGSIWLLVGADHNVYRSTDGALTFTPIALGGPANLIAGDGRRVVALDSSGASVSVDYGATFARQNTPLGNLRTMRVSGATVVAVGSQGAIAYSTNGGTPMSRVPIAWTAAPGPGAEVYGDGASWFAHDGHSVNAAFVRLDSDGTIVTAIGSAQGALPNNSPFFPGNDGSMQPAGDPLLSGVSGGSGAIVFVHGGQVQVSVDGGQTRRTSSFASFSPKLTRAFGSTLFSAGVNVFSGLPALARSLDLGLSWSVLGSAGSTPTASPLAIGVDAANPSTMMLSTYEGGVFVTRDGGTSFEQCTGVVTFDGGVPTITSLHGDSDVWIAGGHARYPGVPPPSPQRWAYRALITPTTCNFGPMAPLAFDRIKGTGALMVSVGSDGIRRSTDRMMSSTQVYGTLHSRLAYSGSFWLAGGAFGASASFDDAQTFAAIDHIVPAIDLIGIQSVAVAPNGTAMVIDDGGRALLYGPP